MRKVGIDFTVEIDEGHMEDPQSNRYIFNEETGRSSSGTPDPSGAPPNTSGDVSDYRIRSQIEGTPDDRQDERESTYDLKKLRRREAWHATHKATRHDKSSKKPGSKATGSKRTATDEHDKARQRARYENDEVWRDQILAHNREVQRRHAKEKQEGRDSRKLPTIKLHVPGFVEESSLSPEEGDRTEPRVTRKPKKK